MSDATYQTSPISSKNLPPGIPYIVGNEAAERFSFYGMKTILYVFMTEYVRAPGGGLDVMTENQANTWLHMFVFSAYFFPILGALVADAFLGKYRTILYLSIVYCLGHFVLAVNETRYGLLAGLCLIALGTGAIKPCVSAHVGDQFGKQNQHLMSKVFGWFYFSINFGSFFSTLLTPLLLEKFGPGVAFGLPGVLMFIATVVFWMGRNKFVHIPPGGVDSVQEAFGGEGLKAMGNLILIYVFVAMFWSLYDQTASAWVEQAKHMDLVVHLPSNLLPNLPATVNVLPSQIQAVNPILVLVLIPLFAYVIYPAIDKAFRLTPLRKISIGFFVTAAAFAVSGWIQMQIDAGETPNVIWQVWAYVVLTAAEVMVSITCLEFSYTQAPNRIKSFVMSLYLLSVAAGNLFTAGVNFVIGLSGGESLLEGANYYWFFTICMLAAAVVFVVASQFYRGKTYIQETGLSPEDSAEILHAKALAEERNP